MSERTPRSKRKLMTTEDQLELSNRANDHLRTQLNNLKVELATRNEDHEALKKEHDELVRAFDNLINEYEGAAKEEKDRMELAHQNELKEARVHANELEAANKVLKKDLTRCQAAAETFRVSMIRHADRVDLVCAIARCCDEETRLRLLNAFNGEEYS